MKPLGFPLGSNSRIVISALASLRRDSNIAAVERFISKSHHARSIRQERPVVQNVAITVAILKFF